MGVIIPSFFLPEVIQFVSVQNTEGKRGKMVPCAGWSAVMGI